MITYKEREEEIQKVIKYTPFEGTFNIRKKVEKFYFRLYIFIFLIILLLVILLNGCVHTSNTKRYSVYDYSNSGYPTHRIYKKGKVYKVYNNSSYPKGIIKKWH